MPFNPTIHTIKHRHKKAQNPHDKIFYTSCLFWISLFLLFETRKQLSARNFSLPLQLPLFSIIAKVYRTFFARATLNCELIGFFTYVDWLKTVGYKRENWDNTLNHEISLADIDSVIARSVLNRADKQMGTNRAKFMKNRRRAISLASWEFYTFKFQIRGELPWYYYAIRANFPFLNLTKLIKISTKLVDQIFNFGLKTLLKIHHFSSFREWVIFIGFTMFYPRLRPLSIKLARNTVMNTFKRYKIDVFFMLTSSVNRIALFFTEIFGQLYS